MIHEGLIFREGVCRVVKIVSFVEESTVTATVLHPLPPDYQECHDPKLINDDLTKYVKKIFGSTLNVAHRLVNLAKLGPNEYFGDSNGFIVNSAERVQNTMLDKTVHEIEYFARVRDGSSVSILSDSKVELVCLTKSDFHRLSSENTWKVSSDLI
jgi:hypothetical protein